MRIFFRLMNKKIQMLKIIMSTSRTYKTNDWGTPTFILDQYKGWFDPCPFPRPEWDGLTVNWLSHDMGRKVLLHANGSKNERQQGRQEKQ